MKGFWDTSAAMNAIVAGLVGITGPCGVVDPWAAAVIGFLSGGIYCVGWRFHERLFIDDPVHAIAVHAWPGVWGCIAPGLFATPKQIKALGYVSHTGLFYSGRFDQLGAQLVALGVVLSWTVCTSATVFLALRACGILRVQPNEEAIGIDVAEHGQPLFAGQRKQRPADHTSRSSHSEA
jgi:ammonium transporter, Amt family